MIATVKVAVATFLADDGTHLPRVDLICEDAVNAHSKYDGALPYVISMVQLLFPGGMWTRLRLHAPSFTPEKETPALLLLSH